MNLFVAFCGWVFREYCLSFTVAWNLHANSYLLSVSVIVKSCHCLISESPNAKHRLSDIAIYTASLHSNVDRFINF